MSKIHRRCQNITRLIFICTVSLVLLSGIYDSTYTSISDTNQIQITKKQKIQLDSFDVPDVTFLDLEGNEVSLKEYKDKVILLNFWASWCVPCQKEFPDLIRLIAKLGGDAVLLAVSNDSNKKDITKFINRMKRHKDNKGLVFNENIIILWDKDKKITQNIFSTIKLPETIIISPAKGNHEQKMVKKITGADIDWLSDEMILLINFLNEK